MPFGVIPNPENSGLTWSRDHDFAVPFFWKSWPTVVLFLGYFRWNSSNSRIPHFESSRFYPLLTSSCRWSSSVIKIGSSTNQHAAMMQKKVTTLLNFWFMLCTYLGGKTWQMNMNRYPVTSRVDLRCILESGRDNPRRRAWDFTMRSCRWPNAFVYEGNRLQGTQQSSHLRGISHPSPQIRWTSHKKQGWGRGCPYECSVRRAGEVGDGEGEVGEEWRNRITEDWGGPTKLFIFN